MPKDDGVEVTLYVRDGNNVLLETDGVGTVEAEMAYIPLEYAEVISQRRAGDSSFYLFDGIHNVRQLTNDSQVVTDEYSFDGWGNVIRMVEPGWMRNETMREEQGMPTKHVNLEHHPEFVEQLVHPAGTKMPARSFVMGYNC